jgi:hypothetical protein
VEVGFAREADDEGFSVELRSPDAEINH